MLRFSLSVRNTSLIEHRVDPASLLNQKQILFFCLINNPFSPLHSVIRASRRAHLTQSCLWTSATSSTSPKKERKRDTSCGSLCPEARLWSWPSRAESRRSGGSRYRCLILGHSGRNWEWGGTKETRGLKDFFFPFLFWRWCRRLVASVATLKD